MYTRMVLTVVFWCSRMPFDAHGCVSTLMNVTFYAKTLIERDKSVHECRFMNECIFAFQFEFGVNKSIFSGNEQQKV